MSDGEGLVRTVYFDKVDSTHFLIRDFIDFYSDFENLLEILSLSFKSGFLYSRSPFSEGLCQCVGSFLDVYNYLKFSDNGRCFYLVQHHHYLVAMYFPEEKLVFALNSRSANEVLNKIGLVLDSLGEEWEVKEFLGAINGYKRPYHYFYDRAPCLMKMSGIEGFRCIDLTGSAFLSGSLFSDELSSVIVTKSPNNLPGCFINPVFNFGFSGKDRLRDKFDNWLSSRAEFRESNDIEQKISKSSIVCWVGISQQKRAYSGLLETLHAFMIRVVSSHDNVLFVFDGLTRPYHKSLREYAKYSADEDSFLCSLNEMLASSGISFDFVSLSGASAESKLIVAKESDFFISSALTDSMWCAKFAKKPGVVYPCDIVKAKKEHVHPYTFFIPEQSGVLVEGEYSKESYTFNDKVSLLLYDCFEVALRFKKSDYVSLVEERVKI